MDKRKVISLIRKGNNRFTIPVDGQPVEHEFETDGKDVWFTTCRTITNIGKSFSYRIFISTANMVPVDGQEKATA